MPDTARCQVPIKITVMMARSIQPHEVASRGHALASQRDERRIGSATNPKYEVLKWKFYVLWYFGSIFSALARLMARSSCALNTLLVVRPLTLSTAVLYQ